MAKRATAARISFKVAKRRRYPFGSIQNFIASASRNRHGTQVAREPNIGGSVKSNAAASQSSGRRGILVSLRVLTGIGSVRAGTVENAIVQQPVESQCLA